MAKRFAKICQNESVFGNKSKIYFHAYLLNTKTSVKKQNKTNKQTKNELPFM